MAKSVPTSPPSTADAGEGGDERPAGSAAPAVTSLKDVVAALVKQAKKGVVTYDQLNAILPDAVNDPEQLDQILEQLEARGLELVEAPDGDEGDFGEEGGEEGGGWHHLF